MKEKMASKRLNNLVQQTPPDLVQIEQVLNDFAFSEQALVDAAKHATVAGNVELHVLFNKIKPQNMLVLMMCSGLKGPELRRSLKHQVDRGMVIRQRLVTRAMDYVKPEVFKELLSFVSYDVMYSVFTRWLMRRRAWDMRDDLNEDVVFKHIFVLVNVYLTKGCCAIQQIRAELRCNRGQLGLIRYVQTYHDRETIQLLGVVAARKSHNRVKLPLDLVKKLATMLLGENCLRIATQSEIMKEGRWEPEEEVSYVVGYML
jgi:hypothetical protein